MPSQEAAAGKSMLVTENVIRDLVPLYFEGEASADSRSLVEKWFASDPAFAQSARRQSDAISTVATADAAPVSEESVRRALRRAHRIILVREVSLGLAGALSLFCIAIAGFVILSPARQANGSGNAVFTLIVCFLVAAANWGIYLKVRRQTGPGLP